LNKISTNIIKLETKCSISKGVVKMADLQLTKKAMIAAVTEALTYKGKSQCSDDEAIAHVVTNINSIISRVN